MAFILSDGVEVNYGCGVNVEVLNDKLFNRVRLWLTPAEVNP